MSDPTNEIPDPTPEVEGYEPGAPGTPPPDHQDEFPVDAPVDVPTDPNTGLPIPPPDEQPEAGAEVEHTETDEAGQAGQEDDQHGS